MKNSTRLTAPLLLAFLATTALADPGAVGEVSFEKDLMPTLKRRCGACHITGDEPGKMALVPGKAYEYLVNADAEAVAMKRVAPGEPDNSYLIHKIQGTHLEVGGNGVRMPFHQGPLPQKQIDQFRRWIEQGAKNN